MIFVYYNNGYFEAIDKINLTLLHMIEAGVIKIIYDPNNKRAWIKDAEGFSKEVEVPTVSGL